MAGGLDAIGAVYKVNVFLIFELLFKLKFASISVPLFFISIFKKACPKFPAVLCGCHVISSTPFHVFGPAAIFMK
jgi:hypothetical protein